MLAVQAVCNGIDGVVLTVGNPNHSRTGSLFALDGTLPRVASMVLKTIQQCGRAETTIKCSAAHVYSIGNAAGAREVTRDGLDLGSRSLLGCNEAGLSGCSEHFVGAVADVLALVRVMNKGVKLACEEDTLTPVLTTFSMVLKREYSDGSCQTATLRFIELLSTDTISLDTLDRCIAASEDATGSSGEEAQTAESAGGSVLSEMLMGAIGGNSQVSVLLGASSDVSHAGETRALLELSGKLRKKAYTVESAQGHACVCDDALLWQVTPNLIKGKAEMAKLVEGLQAEVCWRGGWHRDKVCCRLNFSGRVSASQSSKQPW